MKRHIETENDTGACREKFYIEIGHSVNQGFTQDTKAPNLLPQKTANKSKKFMFRSLMRLNVMQVTHRFGLSKPKVAAEATVIQKEHSTRSTSGQILCQQVV